MREPLTLRLSLGAIERSDGILHLLKSRTGELRRELVFAFAFKNDERQFARTLLRKRTSLWLFRTHQRRFCGDFVVVDMACTIARRRAWAIDLKQNAPLRIGGGGAGVAFRSIEHAIAEIAANHGIVDASNAAIRMSGDGRALLRYFNAG